MAEADPAVVAQAGRVLAERSRFIRDANSSKPQQHSRGETFSPPAEAAPTAPSNESVSEAAPVAAPVTPPKAAPEAQPEPTPPQTYKLRLSGQEVEMPREHVERLLAKVHSADKEVQDVAQARKALALDYSVAEWAKTATPQQRAALQSILEGRTAGAPAAPADDDEADEDAPRSTTPPDYEQMKAVTSFLMQAEEKRLKAAADAERDATIDKALGEYAEMKANKGLAALARAKIRSDLAADPKLDVLATVAANAAEYGAWAASARKSEAQPTSAVARGASGSPARGNEAGFTAKDLRDGKVRDAVLRDLRSGALQRR